MIINKFDALEKKLVKAGFPPTSPWWRDTLLRFYQSGKRQLVIRKGRRAGGSSTLSGRVAVLEALHGEHKIPLGDVGVIAFVSVNRDEAAQRLRTVEASLTALGVPFERKKDQIDLLVQGRPIVFRTYAAGIGAVSGFTSIAIFADEVAKWRDNDSGANPATEVLASIRPTMATMPNAKIFMISSPMGTLDAHAEAFDRGNTDFQMVAHCATWEANPTITEADTHALEPDPRVWTREYAALAQSSDLACFDPAAIDRAFTPRDDLYLRGERVLIVDPSSGRKDDFTYGIAGWNVDERGKYYREQDGRPKEAPWGGPWEVKGWTPTNRPLIAFDTIDAIEGKFWQQTSGDEIVDKIAALAKARGIRKAFGDQRESLMLTSAFSKRGISYTALDWTSQSKPVAVETVRRWFADDAIALPQDEKIRKELINFREKVTPSGQLSFEGRSDDRVALLVTLAIAESRGLVPRSPNKKQVPRGVGQVRLFPY